LVNDILDRAVAQLEAIVLAERFYRNGEAIAYRSRRVLESPRPVCNIIRRSAQTCAGGFRIDGTLASSNFPLEMIRMTIETSSTRITARY